MKKLSVFLLITVMVLSFTSCSMLQSDIDNEISLQSEKQSEVSNEEIKEEASLVEEIEEEEITVESKRDLIRIIYISIYAGNRANNYEVKRTGKRIKKMGYEFPLFEIIKR